MLTTDLNQVGEKTRITDIITADKGGGQRSSRKGKVVEMDDSNSYLGEIAVIQTSTEKRIDRERRGIPSVMNGRTRIKRDDMEKEERTGGWKCQLCPGELKVHLGELTRAWLCSHSI